MPKDTTTPGIGHNLDPVEALRQGLKERYAKLASRILDIEDAVDRLPAKVEDEKKAADLGDFIGQCRAALKALNDAHKIEKDDSLRIGQAIDKWRADLRVKVEAAIQATTRVLQPFMDAQRLAEKKRLEAEEAERIAKERARLEAEAAERKKVEAAEAAAAAAEAEEARKNAQLAAAAAEQASGEMKDTAEAAAAELANRALEAKQAAEAAAAQAAAPVEQVQVQAELIDPRVRIPGQLNRVMGKAEWTWEWVGDGPDKFDLNTVREWMPPEAVSRAIGSAVKAGARKLGPCVRVYEDTKVVV